MSGFNFGGGSTGGFAFGTPKTSVTTATTGFAFGPSATSGGFSFGSATQTPAPSSSQPTGPFSFSTPAPTPAPTSGFSFGTQGTSTPAPASGALPFGANTPKLNLGTQPGVPATQPLSALFGSTPAQNPAPVTSSGGFSFGNVSSSSNAFGQSAISTGSTFGSTLSTATSTTASIPQPTPSFTLGVAPTAATSLNFGMPPSTQSSIPFPSSAPASSQSGTAPSLSLSFVKPSDTTSGVAPTAISTTTAPSLSSLLVSPAPSLFSSVATSTAAPAVSSTANTLTLTSTAGSPFALKTLSSSTAGTLASITPLGIKSSLVAPGTVVQTNAVSSVAATGVSATTTMTYAQLENLINKWSLELEDQEKHFLQQATQVNAWDRTVIHNGERITGLHREMEKVKLDQKRLDQELDFILSQQKELEDLLIPLEESVKEQSGTIYLQHADEEREKTYKLAENIDAQLKRMAQDLKDVIEHLNTTAGPGDASNPLQQICKILNAHMGSLQWIDQNSALLQRKVEQVTKECEIRRKEQERGFPIAFD
ncbi:hypothetical protein GDO86_014996 [Hymenochirus boettgeri]|uniref:Nuclear pore glycoprotein p62 n=1 Tax=Hymenochirus boettgeri TaxID=247094 RepID=A0A8T2JWU8_9PIPI|nr:hypothetical protein GDO86_014996 [Hymenochirus boettgeri]